MSGFNFKGKRILVTGASKGLGAEISKVFSKCQGCVIAADIAFDDEQKTLLKNEGVEDFICFDVSDPKQVSVAFDQLKDIDVLVNNAAIYPCCDFFDLTPNLWNQMIDIDLNSVFYCTQAAAKLMLNANHGGSIINITTIDAFHPSYGHSHYCAAKAGVLSLTISAASKLGEHDIRVNAVAPGLVNRPTLKTDWPDGYSRFIEKSALGRVPQPNDVANTCLFLASDYARCITGTEIPVDSGVLCAAPY